MVSFEIKSLKAKKLLFHFRLLHWLPKVIAVPMQQSDAEKENFYSQSVPSKHTIVVMHQWRALHQRSESKNDLFPFLIASLSAHGYDISNEPIRNKSSLQSNDAKLTIVRMFWMFRNYSPTSLFSCSVLHDFNSMWQCHLHVSQLSPIYTYTIC